MEQAQQIKLDSTGYGIIRVQLNNVAVRWIVNQVNVSTATFTQNCVCEIQKNGQYLCATIGGSNDSATGSETLFPSDELEIIWVSGVANDSATAVLYYDEVPNI